MLPCATTGPEQIFVKQRNKETNVTDKQSNKHKMKNANECRVAYVYCEAENLTQQFWYAMHIVHAK